VLPIYDFDGRQCARLPASIYVVWDNDPATRCIARLDFN